MTLIARAELTRYGMRWVVGAIMVNGVRVDMLSCSSLAATNAMSMWDITRQSLALETSLQIQPSPHSTAQMAAMQQQLISGEA